ncbi:MULTISPECIES: carph-isopro domain-containing protein [Roseomonadaceae]|uniref:Transcriptional regulator n=1 Tax=Falsiroseomonas oleicola TaxID=2801474 RepID=A0ABS6H5L2_9PROT|nr:hypothetical protein [Roseomonas oleicola]MBU8543977.1 hypothetical protein [Roseomonas oleicola]
MTDADLIDALGGATTCARLLGLARGRVAMWRTRGAIPAEHHLALWRIALEREIGWAPPNADALRQLLARPGMDQARVA